MVSVEKYLDRQGELLRDDFVKVAQDHKLLELNNLTNNNLNNPGGAGGTDKTNVHL